MYIMYSPIFSSQLESFVTSSSYSEAIDYYLEFCRLATRLKDSECHNLKQWVCAISAHWKKVLKFKMSRYVCECMYVHVYR